MSERTIDIPDFVLDDVAAGRLKRSDVAILAHLIRLSGAGRLSGQTNQDLARACEVCTSTFKTSLRRLVGARRIEVWKVRKAYRRVLVIPWLLGREVRHAT